MRDTLCYEEAAQFDHETIQFGAVHAQAQATPQFTLDPAAYLSAFLLFQNALPAHLLNGMSPDVAAAVSYHQAHPVAVASYEYMQAYVNLVNAGQMVYNLSLTAIEHISADVAAYAQVQLVGQPDLMH